MATFADLNSDATQLQQRVERFHAVRESIVKQVREVIVGQDEVLDQVLIALFVGGHCLITGLPGTAKTLMVRTLAEALGLAWHPNVVDVIEHGHLPDGTSYLVMELLRGETLASRLERIHELTGLDPMRSEDRERLGLGLKAQQMIDTQLAR